MAMKSLSGEVNQSSSSILGSVASNTKSYTASVLNNDSPVFYDGAETDSLKITVDNATRTISGDVKWQNMIATNDEEEDAYHAYPANKARIMFNQIRSELESLSSSVSTLDKSCLSSVQTIMRYVEDLSKIQSELEDCNKSLISLNGAISKEALSREQADLKLKNAHTAAVEALNSEMSQLISSTQTHLDNQDEVLARNSTAISTESERAKKSEEQLDNKIQLVNKAVTSTNKDLDKVNARAESLNKRLNALENVNIGSSLETQKQDIDALSSTVSDIQTKTGVNIDALKQTTSTLSDVVYKNSSRITELDSLLKHTKDMIQDSNDEHFKQASAIEDLQKRYDIDRELRDDQYELLANSVLGESDVRRSTDELHEKELSRLEKRISNLQKNMYTIVHDLGEELRLRDNELQESIFNVSFAFIDGGRAPI